MVDESGVDELGINHETETITVPKQPMSSRNLNYVQ